MSQVALHLYRKLHEARNDEARSDAIVEAFSELEERFPGLKDTATRQHLSETELRLQKEIEGVRLEIKQVEGSLRKEIEQVRLEIKQVEGNLHKEIKQVEGSLRKEIEQVRLEIKQVEGNLQKEIEGVRLEIKQVEGSLRKEIEQVRLEIEKTRTDMKRIELEMARAMHRQTLWVVGSIGTLITAIRLLDWFLAHGAH